MRENQERRQQDTATESNAFWPRGPRLRQSFQRVTSVASVSLARTRRRVEGTERDPREEDPGLSGPPKIAATPVRPAPTQRCQISSRLRRGRGVTRAAVSPFQVPARSPRGSAARAIGRPDNRTVFARPGGERRDIHIRRPIAITRCSKRSR